MNDGGGSFWGQYKDANMATHRGARFARAFPFADVRAFNISTVSTTATAPFFFKNRNRRIFPARPARFSFHLKKRGSFRIMWIPFDSVFPFAKEALRSQEVAV
jgi:hypothetical protein